MIPKRRVFADEQERPTASVILHWRDRAESIGQGGRPPDRLSRRGDGRTRRHDYGPAGAVLQRAQEDEGFAAMSQYEEQVRA